MSGLRSSRGSRLPSINYSQELALWKRRSAWAIISSNGSSQGVSGWMGHHDLASLHNCLREERGSIGFSIDDGIMFGEVEGLADGTAMEVSDGGIVGIAFGTISLGEAGGKPDGGLVGTAMEVSEGGTVGISYRSLGEAPDGIAAGILDGRHVVANGRTATGATDLDGTLMGVTGGVTIGIALGRVERAIGTTELDGTVMGVTDGVTVGKAHDITLMGKGKAAVDLDSILIDGGISNDAGSNTAGSGGSVGVATSTGSKQKELIGEANSTDSFWTA
jgi:hypothetical protein